jgi:hypothetical protein
LIDKDIQMSVRTEETGPAADPVEPAEPVIADLHPPGLQDSLVLAMDSLLTFVRLFKAETALALSILPAFVALSLTRLPVYLLTWISFAVFVAAAVYTFTENILLTTGAFFILQLALAFLLERILRKAREACSMPETRKSMALAIAGLKERFNDEQRPS